MTPTVWQRAIDIVHDINFKDPKDYAGILVSNSFTGVMVKIHDGTDRTNEDGLKEWISTLRHVGVLFVGGWGVQQDDPANEARLAADIVNEGLDFYVADAEGPYKGDWPDGDPRRSLVFVQAYEKTAAQTKAHALTTFGAAPSPWLLGHIEDNTLGPRYHCGPMRFQPWYRRGWRFLPQCYPNLDPVYSVDSCLDHARRSGWPLPWVHLTIGLYQDKLGWPTGEMWVPQLIRARSLGVGAGFQTFLADVMNSRGDSDYVALGKLVKPFVPGSGAVAYK
jgi:hypothetical protein